MIKTWHLDNWKFILRLGYMANHGPSYGLDAELLAKQNSKFDPVVTAKVVNWISAVTGEKITAESIHADLKSGVVLCKWVI